MPRKDAKARQPTARRITDLLKEMVSVEDATASEIGEVLDMRPEHTYNWIDAFEEVGLFVKSTPRKREGQIYGRAATTWKLADWVRQPRLKKEE